MARVVVLAYHAIADLSDDPVLANYGVPPERFADQLDGLLRRGWRFVELERLLEALDGRARLPRRAALVTFDDGYADVHSAALPILRARGIPAVVFAVSGPRENEWDQARGARPRRLLDEDERRQLAEQGVEIGAHGSTHRALTELSREELAAELDPAAREPASRGLPRPRALSYPHGRWSPEVADAARASGYQVAFGLQPGRVTPTSDRFALPRVEVLPDDRPGILHLKLCTAEWPARVRHRLFARLGASL